MVKVSRDGTNTLVFRKVTVRFRMYPGDDKAGALGRMRYVLKAPIASVAGITRPDGSVTLRVPCGGTASLEIFGSTYEIGLAGPLPPSTTLAGVQRRLSMLGYRAGPEDGKPDARTEIGALGFQADHDLDPRGLDNAGNLDAATRAKLEGLTSA